MREKRSDPVQEGPPPDGTEGFPVAGVLPFVWHREHGDRPEQPDRGCWWFSSYEPGAEPSGRFDLLAPNGTCYLAETEGVAVRERCGRFLAAHMPIPESHMEGRVVSTVTMSPMADPVADMTSPNAATFGVTGELAAGNDYFIASIWAQGLFDADFRGLLYQPRFTPGTERALALFNDSAAPIEDRMYMVVERTVPLSDAILALGYRTGGSPIPSSTFLEGGDDVDPETT